MKHAFVSVFSSALTFKLGAKKQSTTIAESRNTIATITDVGVMLLDGKFVLNTALARELNCG